MQNVTINDFLTEKQIEQAIELYKTAQPGTFATRCAETIIQPNIKEINRKLGQENDPKYLAYAVEYVLSQATA